MVRHPIALNINEYMFSSLFLLTQGRRDREGDKATPLTVLTYMLSQKFSWMKFGKKVLIFYVISVAHTYFAVVLLKELHLKALNPSLDSDTARDEHEIELQTKEITKVFLAFDN